VRKENNTGILAIRKRELNTNLPIINYVPVAHLLHMIKAGLEAHFRM
jgi:hypothetical protein